MSKVANILEGWAKYAQDKMGKLDPATKKLAESRMAICDECPIRVGDICAPWKSVEHTDGDREVLGCGCMLAAKTLVDGETCPAGKW